MRNLERQVEELPPAIFHCFYQCHSLFDLFLYLQVVFTSFTEVFSKQGFIYGFIYTRQAKTDKSQLLNFVLGQAKMAVYITRKRKVEQNVRIEPVHCLYQHD